MRNKNVLIERTINTEAFEEAESFLRWPEVKARLKISRSTARRNERNPALSFPKRRSLGAKSVAWLKSEIDEYIATRKLATEVERSQP